MNKVLNRVEIENILKGATFFGAGGGGSLSMGIDILDNLEKSGKEISLDMIDYDKMNDNEYAAMVAGLGSPIAMVGGTFGPDAVYAYNAFKKAFKAEGKSVNYLYSGEMGGFNTVVPMMVAMLAASEGEQIKFIDADGNGRAVPELNTSLNSARGIPPYPMGLGNLEGDEIAVYPVNDKNGELIARTLCMAYNMQIGFSTWGMSKQQLKESSVIGSVSQAMKVGEILSEGNNVDVIIEKLNANDIPSRLLCTGKITKINVEVKDGFDVGKTYIQGDDNKSYMICFQNENLVAYDSDNTAIITAPERICTICLDEGENKNMPLTNADTKEGMRIAVILSPADERWWKEDKKAYECWIDALGRTGYTDEQIRY